MDDLVQFLRARLDEDERQARAAMIYQDANWRVEISGIITTSAETDVYTDDRELAEHIARHDPARVLREIEAKRQMLVEHAPCRPTGRPNMEKHCQSCTTAQAWDDVANESNCQTLRLLALPYADRPGYRDEWRP